MSKPAAPDKITLRIKRHTHPKHGGACMVWLIANSKTSSRGLMYGVVSSEDAELLSASLGITIDDTEIANETIDDMIERHAEKTALEQG